MSTYGYLIHHGIKGQKWGTLDKIKNKRIEEALDLYGEKEEKK